MMNNYTFRSNLSTLFFGKADEIAFCKENSDWLGEVCRRYAGYVLQLHSATSNFPNSATVS